MTKYTGAYEIEIKSIAHFTRLFQPVKNEKKRFNRADWADITKGMKKTVNLKKILILSHLLSDS